MGHLTFSALDVTVISTDAVLVFGRYTLKREKDEPTGLFTLLFRKLIMAGRLCMIILPQRVTNFEKINDF